VFMISSIAFSKIDVFLAKEIAFTSLVLGYYEEDLWDVCVCDNAFIVRRF